MAQNDIWRLPYSAQQLTDAATNQVPQISSTTGNWEAWDIATEVWVDTGVPAAGKNPYIGNDNYWYVWDAVQNQYVKTNYSVAQDAVQSVNGVFADSGGNVTIDWENISGALPTTKGGTGQTTPQSGLRTLISGCSALTNSGIATVDYVPIQDVSDTTNAKKVTIENFIKYFAENIPYITKIQSGSYIGTGTYGVDNPNSLIFDFVPKIVFCGNNQLNLSNYISGSRYYMGTILTDMLTTSYASNYGFGAYTTGSGATPLYAKKSSDGKTLSWYGTASGEYQNNKNNTTYYWLAIG